jgi:hypothetical protein
MLFFIIKQPNKFILYYEILRKNRMKLSKVLAITLFGAIAMTNTATASGTVAGTKITNTPTLSYSMGGTKKTLKAPVSSYVVDKVINFTVKRDTAYGHKLMVGTQEVAPFTIQNIGNSIENFVVVGHQSSSKEFKFSKTQIFIDKSRNGILEKAEKVNNNLIKQLKINGKIRVWVAVKTSVKTVLNKKNSYGIQVRATAKGLKEIYQKQTVKNTMSRMDIVFAENTYGAGGDKARDNKLVLWYKWTTIPVKDAKLTIIHNLNRITADPINGTCKNYKDATSGRFKSIPGATSVRTWKIINNTNQTATNVRFSVKLNSKVEKVATTNKNVWWRGDKAKRVHILWSKAKGIFGAGKYNSKTNSVDFLVKQIKPKEQFNAFTVTEIK